MRKSKIMLMTTLAASLAASLTFFTGCQSETTARTGSGQLSAHSESQTSADTEGELSPTVTLDNTYWAGSNVRVRMLFDKDGNCRYGYVGKYDLETTPDGTPILTQIFYANTDSGQLASSTFALRDNGDGTYSKTVYIEGEQPDFEDEQFTTELALDEGTDGLLSGSVFDGVYVTSDGQYFSFHSDGTFEMDTWMTYAADEDHIEIIGSEESTLYTYEADPDYSRISLYKEGKLVMELATEEAIEGK